MLLAGNAPSLTPKTTAPPAPVHAPMPRSSVPDRLTISQPQPFATTPHRSSPVPMTPISIPQSGGRTSIRTETSIAKPSGVRMSPPINAEPLKTVAPLGSASFLSSGTIFYSLFLLLLYYLTFVIRHSYLPRFVCFQNPCLSFVENL